MAVLSVDFTCSRVLFPLTIPNIASHINIALNLIPKTSSAAKAAFASHVSKQNNWMTPCGYLRIHIHLNWVWIYPPSSKAHYFHVMHLSWQSHCPPLLLFSACPAGVLNLQAWGNLHFSSGDLTGFGVLVLSTACWPVFREVGHGTWLLSQNQSLRAVRVREHTAK